MNTCVGCKEAKTLDLFRKDNTIHGRNGHYRFCKACEAVYRAKWRSKNRDLNRYYRVKERFGLDRNEYEKLLRIQDNKCAICNKPQNERINKKNRESIPRSLHVDHNHETGKVRGLLCGNCNRGLGTFKEDVNLLELAIAYLKKN